MAVADALEKFSKLPAQHKLLGFIFISAIFGLAFYFLFYSALLDEDNTLVEKIKQLEEEKAELEDKKRKYLDLRNKVAQMLERQKDLMKILPTESEIHSLLRSIHSQAELAGLNIIVFEQSPEVYEQYYAKIPVKLEIRGSYHQVNKFFHAVGQLKRIVNIQNLSLTDPQETDQGMTVTATFLASTFRFLAPGETKPAPGPGRPG